MKREYDFSKGERGVFFRPNAKLRLPVYLKEEVLAFVQRVAKRRKTDPSSVVNQLLRGDMHVAELLKYLSAVMSQLPHRWGSGR